MNKIILSLAVILITTLPASSQKVYCLLEDSPGDVTVAEYDVVTNTFSNSFNLNSTNLFNGFSPDASYYDPQTQEIIIASSGGKISTVDVNTGTVTDQTVPFDFSSGYGWALYYNLGGSVGVEEGITIMNVTAFPNPFHDNLTITLPNDIQSNITVNLVDITGRILFSTIVNSDVVTFNTLDIPKGIYVIQLDGGIYPMQKIIKQ